MAVGWSAEAPVGRRSPVVAGIAAPVAKVAAPSARVVAPSAKVASRVMVIGRTNDYLVFDRAHAAPDCSSQIALE
jgi:hypothetical protein